MARQFAKAYTVLVSILALWAWYTDVQLLHSPREHLLPDILLAFVSLPTSLSIDLLYQQWPDFFAKPFMQLAWLTICAATQACLLFFLSGLASKPNVQA